MRVACGLFDPQHHRQVCRFKGLVAQVQAIIFVYELTRTPLSAEKGSRLPPRRLHDVSIDGCKVDGRCPRDGRLAPGVRALTSQVRGAI